MFSTRDTAHLYRTTVRCEEKEECFDDNDVSLLNTCTTCAAPSVLIKSNVATVLKSVVPPTYVDKTWHTTSAYVHAERKPNYVFGYTPHSRFGLTPVY